jgi:two-component system LytT family response regulator
MNLTCYIIDDERHSIDIIKRYIEQTPGLELSGTSINPLEALEFFSESPAPELTFLDVDMPQLNGLDFAELVNPVTKIIFTTAFRDYAPEAFEKNAIDYLIKPINYPRFLKAVTKVKLATDTNNNGLSDALAYFFVKSEMKGKLNRVEIDKIVYIENLGNYIIIHLTDEKITTYLTLSEVLNRLPEDQFSRIHQSFIVNHLAIKSIEPGQIRLYTRFTLPIGGTYRAAFRLKMDNVILLSKRQTSR